MDRPLRSTPEHETAREQRVRLFEEAIERCKVMEKAGLLIETCNGYDQPQWTRQWFERLLMFARQDLRFKRGDI